ncbi:MAG: phosphatidylserine decarboxylase family protein [Saprospiraceae bacterium]|nr:phosphatidylserine decarboxylase family protein [Saprospiraceae bacterium]
MRGIHKEGFSTIMYTVAASVLVIILTYVFAPQWAIVTWILALIFELLILSFFRIPQRTFVEAPEAVISPCDGKVVVIEKVTESEFVQGPCRQISVFMSPLNVHINWHPISARMVYKMHHPGKYLVAWHPKSSSENERMSLGYQMNSTKVLVRQIAGALARRIVNYGVVDVEATQGQEMGFIKFGSRVDIFLPLHWEVLVEPNERLIGGVSKIARIG